MIHDYYKASLHEVERDLNSLGEEILRRDGQSLVDHYTAAYELPTIEQDKTNAPYFEEDKTRHGGGSLKSHEYVYPIVVKEKIDEVIRRQAAQSLVPDIGLRLVGTNLRAPIQIGQGSSEASVKDRISKFEQVVQWKNDDVVKENKFFRALVKNAVEQRVAAVASESESIAKIIEKVGIPLRKRQLDSPLTIQIKKKIIPPIRKTDSIQELTLAPGDVVSVVRVVQNAGAWMVRTPEVFSALKEEHLRDLLIAGLNMVFEGTASSETFSKRGATDIYLVISKGGILIAECKIWKGPEYYARGIEQLFKYLTWNESYGIMITFSKKTGFSEIVESAMSTAKLQSTYIQGTIRKISDTYFVSTHKFPTDARKSVEIHHLLFTLV